MLDKIFRKNDIIASALDGYHVRNEVIANNIANEDTPEFKKKTVKFEVALQDAVEEYRKTGELDLKDVKPSVQVAEGDLSYRFDGNNVNIDTEMADLAKNQIDYYTLVGCIGYKNLQRVLGVIK